MSSLPVILLINLLQIFKCVTLILSETRLRATEKLMNNLRAHEEENFEVDPDLDDLLQQALEALNSEECPEPTETEEEAIDWEDELEFGEDI